MEQTGPNITPFSMNKAEEQTPYSLLHSIIFLFVSYLLQSINSIIIKYSILRYTDTFGAFTFLFYRSIPIIIFSYLASFSTGIKIISFNELPHKKWMSLRANLEFLTIFSFIMSMLYIRCISAQSMINLTPIFIFLVIKVFIGGKMTNQQITGLIICFAGCGLIFKNELSLAKKTSDFVLGVFFSFVSLVSFTTTVLSKKKVPLRQIPAHIRMFYSHILIFAYSVVYFVFTLFRIEFSLGLIITAFLHGCLFFTSTLLNDISSRNGQILKFRWIRRLKLFFVFVQAYCIINEKIFFGDSCGCVIITLYLIYDSFIIQ